MKSLKIPLDSTKFTTREGSSSQRLKSTYIATHGDHIKCDFAAKHDIELFLPFTKVTANGIRYAAPPMLLADKIRTYGDRAKGADRKRETDLEDILQMIDQMGMGKEQMPQQLKELIITEAVMRRFWEVLPPEEIGMYREFLSLVGLT